MWKYLFVLCPFIVTAHAHASSCFKYVETKGHCENKAGERGFNKADAEQLFKNFESQERAYKNVDAECVDFRGFDFKHHLGFESRRMVGWNLKGANFEGVKLHFAHILNAHLAGTNFTDMDWGYVQLSGQRDKYTVLPEGCEHDPQSDKVDCQK